MMLKTVVAAVVVLIPLAKAQSVSDGRTIEALLTEVRQLRQALERSALLTPKVQLTIQRLALQDQRVARLSAQLDSVRKDIAQQNDQIQRTAQQVQHFEQQIAVEKEAVRRKGLEDEHAQLKGMAGKVVDAQLLARESEIASALQYERSIAQELNDKLTAMERLLEVPVPGASSATK